MCQILLFISILFQISIIYSSIGYRQTQLAYSSRASPNQSKIFNQSIDQLLRDFATKNDFKSSEQQGNLMFAVIKQNNIVVVLYADQGMGSNQLYQAGNQIIQDFTKQFSINQCQAAEKLQFQNIFSSRMDLICQRTYQDDNNTTQLLKELDSVKDMVKSNVQAVLNRAQTLDEIQEDALELKEQAGQFQKASGELKRKMMMKKIGMGIAIAIAVACLVLVIVLPIVL